MAAIFMLLVSFLVIGLFVRSRPRVVLSVGIIAVMLFMYVAVVKAG
jgi:hypothetical protein